MARRTLERALESVAGFDDPRVEWEQYPTPADVAAHLVHLASLRGDLGGTTLDLGCGTGVLALGAALASAETVVGVDRDPAALAVARGNATRLDAAARVEWVLADATRPPICLNSRSRPVTVLMNPPFGAQRGNRHADRAFLAAVAEVADVSYSIHNADSREFVEAFAADEGGEVTDAFAAALDVDRQFDFHGEARRTIETEVYRIEWR
ncbi:METTL5 family protein [Halomarina halobia]|uniref:METTL5 family protein n=1 Tax=Halomarina halobia TaxID=3033386 RepID=A0ABD6A5S9_9EURY|nr:METTL5 family protein [Halomarina sp. PSR21]